MFGNRKCTYCNGKVISKDDITVCRSCWRENKALYPLSIREFKPIGEEHLTLIKAKKPGFFENKAHKEIPAAIRDNRLMIATAKSDGCYSCQISKGTTIKRISLYAIPTADRSKVVPIRTGI